MEDQEFGRVPKNGSMDVRVAVNTYRGVPKIDVREFYDVDHQDPDSGKRTRQGVSLALVRLPELIRALLDAEAAAVAAGVIDPGDAVSPSLAPGEL